MYNNRRLYIDIRYIKIDIINWKRMLLSELSNVSPLIEHFATLLSYRYSIIIKTNKFHKNITSYFVILIIFWKISFISMTRHCKVKTYLIDVGCKALKRSMVDLLLGLSIGPLKANKARNHIKFPTLVVFKQPDLGLCNCGLWK